MKLNLAMILTLSFILLTSCIAPAEEESDLTAPSSEAHVNSNTCTYSEKDTYHMNQFTNMNSDFSSAYRDVDAIVTQSNCEGLAVGASATGEAHEVIRMGNKLAINMEQNAEAPFIMNINGSSLSAPIVKICSSGIELTSEITSGSIDSTNHKIIINFRITISDNNCTYTNQTPLPYASGYGNYLESAENLQATTLYFFSEPGDYIGKGKQRIYDETYGKFTVTNSPDLSFVKVKFDGLDGIYWTAEFKAPSGEQLAVESIMNATRYPFQDAANYGFAFTGDNRGCNNLNADFEILELEYNPDNTVKSFQANFTQYCDNSSSSIHGTVRYNANLGPM